MISFGDEACVCQGSDFFVYESELRNFTCSPLAFRSLQWYLVFVNNISISDYNLNTSHSCNE